MNVSSRKRATYLSIAAVVALRATVIGSAIAASLGYVMAAPAPVGTTMYFIGGSASEIPICSRCEVSLPASGTSTLGSTGNTSNLQLSPNVAIVASDLTVHVDTPPGGTRTRLFVIVVRGDTTGLRCTVSGSNDTCHSGAQTYTIPANSQILMDAANIDQAPETRFQFSWRASVK
jgi:hypothetical protein